MAPDPTTEQLIQADRRQPDVAQFAAGVSSDEQHTALRASVRQLGGLLGEALTRHEGPELLALVERVRGLARESDDTELHALLSEVDDATAVQLARAFTAYFQLVNVTEQLHRWQELTTDAQGPLVATAQRIGAALADGSIDRIVGVVKVKEVQAVLLKGRKVQLFRLMRKPPIVPDQLDAMDALRVLQAADVAMALVHDEYGHLEGVVTPADVLSAIVGNFASHLDEGDEPLVVEREDGSLLLSGAIPADAMAARLGIDLPETRDYATAAGFVLSVMKRLPKEGERFDDQGWRFEVVDMDGRKIDKLLVCRCAKAPVVEG